MSRSFARTAPEPQKLAPAASKKSGLGLRIGAVHDSFEREADRVADQVMRGGRAPEWSFAKVRPGPPLRTGPLQRDPAPDPASQDGAAKQQQAAPNPNNYGDAAGKLGQAFLLTDVGKKLRDAVAQDPLVKGAESFASTLPGKIIVDAAATAAVSALAATHQPLPVQIPEIPLDAVKPGLKVKLTYEGPVDRPAKAMITFSFTPQGDTKKPKQSASEQYRAETVRMAADQEKFRAGMRYAPGSPEATQQEADRKMIDDWTLHRFGALPGTGGVPLIPSAGAGQPAASGSQWTFSPIARPDLDKKLDLQPSTAGSGAALQRKCACRESGAQCEECTKSETMQRKAAGSAESVAPPIVDEVLSSSGRPLDRAVRDDLEPRFGCDFSQVRIHADARAAESARAVHALAYTVGDNIAFASGRYAPQSGEGRRLLAHELVHVTQQQGAKGSLVQRQTGPVQVGAPSPDECEGRADITKEFKDFLKVLPVLLQSAPDFTPGQKVSFKNEVDRFLQSEGGVNVNTFKVISCDKINSDFLIGGETASAQVDPDNKEILLSKNTKKLIDDFKQHKDKASLAELIETLAHEKRHVTLGAALKVGPKGVRPGRSETVAGKAEYRAQEILAVAEEIMVGRMAFGGSFAVSEAKQEKLRRQNNMIRGYVTEDEYKRLRSIVIAKLRERYGFAHGCDNALTLGVVSSMDHNRWFECVSGSATGIVPPVPSDLHICEGFCNTQSRRSGPAENEEGSDSDNSAGLDAGAAQIRRREL
jgi:hypothetical protein